MFLYLAMIDSDADKSKFEILYSEYKNLMYYTANRILRKQQRCGGRGASGFSQSHRNSGYHFFTKVSQNACAARHYYRAQSNRPVPRKAAPQCPAACRGIYRSRAAAEIERLAERDTLAAAIASLPPRYRSVLLLRYDCSYSNAEIANILDTTEPNVRKLIQRAKEKLSAALSGWRNRK